MPLVTLKTALDLAAHKNSFAIGFVCLGWEDAQAYVAAGEATGAPVILSAGPGARAHMPIHIWGEMFRYLAYKSSAPVVAHLDHGHSEKECLRALTAGFSSVMFDGSALPLDENIRITQSVVEQARSQGASVEAELGVVGYADGAASAATSVQDVERFIDAVDIDALAISIGNVHLVTEGTVEIDWDSAQAISKACPKPLVIHGGSGVAWPDRTRLAQEFGVRKFNLGTEFRQEYGRSLRDALQTDPTLYDPLQISQHPKAALTSKAVSVLRECGW